MTVSKTQNKIQYAGTGLLTTFAYPFKIFEDSDLTVITEINGTETTETNYSVTGAGDTDGGTVIFNTAPVDTTVITIKRILPVTQETDYIENDPFPAEAHEDALDKLTMIDQQQDEDIDRSLKYPISDASIGSEIPGSDERAEKVLGFDTTGAPVMTSSTVSEIDATVAAAREGGTLISSDSFTGDGTTVAFQITATPVNKYALLIQIGGATQEPSAYAVSSNIVTFTEAPPLDVPFTIRNLGYQTGVNTASASTTTYVQDGGVVRSVQNRLRITKYLSDYTDLDTALTAIGSNETTLVIDVAYTLTVNTTIPSNVALVWLNGAAMDGAYTLTISGTLNPEEYQLFDSDLTVTGLKESKPEWWGIDGIADDIQIQKAIDATVGGIVVFDPLNIYDIDSGIILSENSTTLFSPVRKAGLITSSNDIYLLTIDDCRYAKILNIGLSSTHVTPTKANILLAGRAKDTEFDSCYLAGNKYGVLFDGNQGSVPGGIFYVMVYNITITAATNESVYFTDAAGMNENNFYDGRFTNSNGNNKLIRVTGNNNKFIAVAIETANTTSFSDFTVVDNGTSNVFAFNRFETDGQGILVNLPLTDESNGAQIYGNYWACGPIKVAVYDGIAHSDTFGRDMTFRGFSKGVFVATTVDVQSSSGQTIVSVAATTDFYLDQAVVLDFGNANEEWHLIESIQDGVSITLLGNLVNTHNIGVAVEGSNGLNGMQTFNHENTDALEFYKAGKTRFRMEDGVAMFGDNNEIPSNDSMIITPKTGQTQYHIRTIVTSANARTHQRFENTNGIVGSITTSLSATAYNTSSDYRLKENVTGLTQAIKKLKELRPVTFNFKKDKEESVDGFIAHELQTVIPGAATGRKDELDEKGKPIYQGIDQSKIVPLLTKAVQELLERIETLENK